MAQVESMVDCELHFPELSGTLNVFLKALRVPGGVGLGGGKGGGGEGGDGGGGAGGGSGEGGCEGGGAGGGGEGGGGEGGSGGGGGGEGGVGGSGGGHTFMLPAPFKTGPIHEVDSHEHPDHPPPAATWHPPP